MPENTRQQIAEVIGRIKALHPSLEQTKVSLRADLERFPAVETVHTDDAYWKTRILFDAMVKIRLFVENNFHVIETMGVLSLTRYIFEIAVIIRNIDVNQNFVFLYIQKMKRQEFEHMEEYARHIEAEINFYKSLERAETSANQKILKDIPTGKLTSRNTRRFIKKVSQEMTRNREFIDQSLEFQFAIYAQEAAHNGYGFQAFLMERDVVPKIQMNLEEAKSSYEKIKLAWRGKIQEFDHSFQRWRWKEMAERVQMERDYDFIYSYTSRLLHAFPHSLTTNQKNLEDSEVLMFLKYVEGQIRWILAFAQGKLGKRREH
jgi:hypothetical protein